jgi:hypothetical protein
MALAFRKRAALAAPALGDVERDVPEALPVGLRVQLGECSIPKREVRR